MGSKYYISLYERNGQIHYTSRLPDKAGGIRGVIGVEEGAEAAAYSIIEELKNCASITELKIAARSNCRNWQVNLFQSSLFQSSKEDIPAADLEKIVQIVAESMPHIRINR